MKFGIVSDSSCDLSSDFTEREDVTIVSFYVSFDGENYLKEGKEVGITSFYEEMARRVDCFPKTSMPSVEDYIQAFLPYVKKNIPVLCICLTKKFSGSMQAAVNARTEIMENYSDAQIYVMDSRLVTALQGLFVQEAVRLRNQGLSLKEAAEALENIRDTGHIFFTTKDLKYLEHGGRIGKAASIAGSMLNIKPLLQYFDGELGPTELCRGRKKSLQKIVDKFVEYLEEKQIDLSQYLLVTGVGLEVPEYEDFKQLLIETLKGKGYPETKWERIQIGATIGVHTGPYPLGVGILKKCQV
ncbi:MAG: DegV family protein [Blautia sp.]|jgi:DegV family protein with EDD domain